MKQITILRAPGQYLTKRYWRATDGTIGKEGAPRVAEFVVEFIDYEDAEGLFAAFEGLAHHADRCVIRAVPGRHAPQDTTAKVYRRLHTQPGWADRWGAMIPDARMRKRNATRTKAGEPVKPSNVTWLAMFADDGAEYVAIDVEKLDWAAGADWVNDLEEVATVIRDTILPAEFKGASCWVQATGSALDPTKAGTAEWAQIRLRLVFKLTRRLVSSQLTRWLRGRKGVDHSTLHASQPCYTAHPVFRGGLRDHLPQRSVTVWAERDEVDPPELEIGADHGGVAGEFASATGRGLEPVEAFEEALERIDDAAGECRARCGQAAAIYARAVGRNNVDAEALVERLTAEALQYRSTAEVEGYNLAGLVAWHCSRAPEHPDYNPFGEPAGAANDDNHEPAEPPVDISVEEAATTLAAAVRGWVTEGLLYHPDPGTTPPKLAIRAAAGIGKTTVTLETLAELAGGKTVWYFVPTHDLADELKVKAKSEAMGIPSVIIQGRGRPHPHDVNRHMCAKNDLAEAVAKEGLNVWKSICENKDLIGITQEHKCEHFDHCPYIGQFEGIEGHLIIMPHNWLTLPKPKALPAADLVVIDERFFDIGIRKSHWSWSRITRPLPFGAAPFEGFDPGEHVTTAEAVSKALWAGEHPRQHGLTVKLLETAAKAEYYMGQTHSLHPAMGAMHQKRLVQEYASKKEHRQLARVYRLLAADFDLDRPSQRVHVVKGRKTPDGVVDDVFMHWTDYRIPGAPTLLIDADADPVITEPIIPGVEFLEIKPPIQARVVQVLDTACSRRKLTEDSSSPRTLRRIAALATREANKRQKVLLTAYKPAIDMVGEIEGVDCNWFGNLRGIDRYKYHDTVIIAGREQTRAVVVENAARALFGADPEPLTLPGDYVTSRRRYITRDGHERFGPVQVHPDSRVQAIVAQSRECETTQAVARLRLIHREHPATVYLLSNMPTDLVVDEFVAFGALLPDKAEQAAQESGGVELLTASELARCYPDRWPSTQAAKHFLRRREKGPKSLKDSIGKMDLSQNPREATYRTPASYPHARPYRALIPGHLSFPEGIDALVKVVGEITHFSEDPRHDGPADDDAQEASA